jgi:hypothetical protein
MPAHLKQEGAMHGLFARNRTPADSGLASGR